MILYFYTTLIACAQVSFLTTEQHSCDKSLKWP